jgi:hypothetical protein
MILKTGKDFSDELINLYEETTETAEVSAVDKANNISTVLAATDIDTAYNLLEATNSKLAKLINKGDRYSISFKNLEEVVGYPISTPGLLEF